MAMPSRLAFSPRETPPSVPPVPTHESTYSEAEAGEVEERLRGLGYLE